MERYLGLTVLALYVVMMLFVGWYSNKKSESNLKDYAVASGSFGILVLALTFSASYHSAYAFMGTTGFLYTHGIGWWVNGLWTVLPGVLFWVWGRRFWYLGKTRGYMSIAQYIGDTYESQPLGMLVALVGIFFTVLYISMQAIGSGYIFDIISNGLLPYSVGVVIFFAAMILYVWMGGLRAVGWTDTIQGIIMFIGMIVGAYFVARNAFGGVFETFKIALDTTPDLFYLPGPSGGLTWGKWYSLWLVITIGMMMFPHISLRFFAGKSLKVLKWSAVFSSAYLTFLYVLTPAVGMAAKVLFPAHGSPDQLFPVMLLEYTPLLFAVIVIGGALAASMSTGDSQLHAASTLITTDIYKKHINKDATDKQLYKVARSLVIILGLLSVIIALGRPGLLGNILSVANGGVAVLAPTVVGGIYWKKSTSEGAFWSIILGEVVIILTTYFLKLPGNLDPGLWGLIVSLVIFVVVSLATDSAETTRKNIDELNQFFGGVVEESN